MKISRSSSLFVAIGSLLTIVFLTVLLPHVDAQKSRVKLLEAETLTYAAGNADGKTRRELGTDSRVATASLVPAADLATPLINEIDADQTGTDSASFIELVANPGTSLNGYVLVLYNGNGDVSYLAIDLDGITTNSFGFATVGNAGIPGVDLTIAGDFIQNGADAIALYTGDATNFPNGTPFTTTNLIDAVVYDTADADDSELLTLLNPGSGRMQIDETGGSNPTLNSIQRCVNLARDWRRFIVRVPTPDNTNSECQSRQEGNVDMNGDGRSDFVITRQSVSGANISDRFATGVSRAESRRQRLFPSADAESLAAAAGQLEWWIAYNNAPGGVTLNWGLSEADLPVSADFDGDNSDDVAIWRPGVPGEAGFYSLNSSDGTFRYSDFGLTGDDPSVAADYDGDGLDDPATFRCPDFDPGQCYFFYRGSLNNPAGNITYVPWGYGSFLDYFPYPGDFNGDGKYDFAVQDLRATQGVFWVLFNGTGTHEVVEWGLSLDFLVPGDFDGDGKSDFCVLRNDGEKFTFWILERDGGIRTVQWGIPGDLAVPGDYDGDGKQDIAVQRENATDTTFWILPSNGDPHWTFNYGLPGDYPVANWYVQ